MLAPSYLKRMKHHIAGLQASWEELFNKSELQAKASHNPCQGTDGGTLTQAHLPKKSSGHGWLKLGISGSGLSLLKANIGAEVPSSMFSVGH